MREGLQPARPSTLARLVTDEATARRIADLIGESFDPAETAVAAFEIERGPHWSVEIYFGNPPNEAAVRDLVALAADAAMAAALSFAALDPKDWVASALDGLAPVRAGRFVVHGSHDRARVPPNAIALEVEAALAFGTGHHGTTRGCLLALDAALKYATPQRILDVGTGTGVLALAAARALHRTVQSTDIDLDAVEAARGNAHLNRVGAQVRVWHTGRLDAAAIRTGGPYDLVLANILMRPLMGLAPSIRRLLAPGATVILSGLLPEHMRGVVAAYRNQGLRLIRRQQLDGWATLVFAQP